MTDARRATLLDLVPASTVVGSHVWPDELDPATWTGFRRQAASAERPLEHVAPEELGNAMVALCRAADGLPRDDLLNRAAVVFGYRRRTPTITPALEAALAQAVRSGRLSELPSGLFTA